MAPRQVFKVSGLLCAMAVLFLLVRAAPVLAADFSGQFDGIGTAGGMKLTIEEADGRVVGRFDSGRGDPFTLNGRRTGEAAQGSVNRRGQTFFFHIEPRPLGLQFLLIPKAPEGGPDIAGATDYSFVQQGLQLPKPSDHRPAPPRGIEVDILEFIDAFRDWSPSDMTRVYASLDVRYQELIQLFDHAAAEVLWRVCTTRPPNAAFSQADLDRLLERQRTRCADFLPAIAAVRDAGLLGEFIRKANFQFELIRETVKCDRSLSPETKCADVSAMSSPLMMRWRRAEDLMADLVGDLPAEGEASVPDVAEVPVPLPAAGAVETAEAAPVASPVAAGSVPLPRPRPGSAAVSVESGLDDVPRAPVPRERPGLRLRP